MLDFAEERRSSLPNLNNGCLESDDLENDDLENDDLENNDLENDDLENDDPKKTAGSGVGA